MNYIIENAEWLTPIIVAIIGGIFALFKKSSNSNKQIAKDIHNSQVNQINGSSNELGK